MHCTYIGYCWAMKKIEIYIVRLSREVRYLSLHPKTKELLTYTEMQHINFTFYRDSPNAMASCAGEEKLIRGWNNDGLTCVTASSCVH